MLALTRKTDYALIALSFLAQEQAEAAKPVSAKRIAETFGLPLPLLMNILKELVQAKVLSSTRGPHGGYALAIEPDKLTLLEVVTALEGPMRLTQCSDGLPVVGQGCELSDGCPIRGTLRSLHRRINDFLGEVSLQDLYQERAQAPGNGRTAAHTGGHDTCACRSTTPPATAPIPKRTA